MFLNVKYNDYVTVVVQSIQSAKEKSIPVFGINHFF